MTLSNKRILLIIGGGIAAFKALELIREIKRQGGRVSCILTKAGAEFVTPLSLASLSGEKVYTDLFSLTDETEMGHIELSRSANLIVTVPATADLMAKAANGLANDLASTTLLATDKPVLMAPAMNVRMWQHAATQRNLATLLADGTLFVGPNNGEMACGEFGPGRMAEVPEIIAAIAQALNILEHDFTRKPVPTFRNHALAGKHVLITSGPTHEPIDPVRYIANRSSGKQGHALAAAAAAAGAHVTLISGPVALADPLGVTTVHVETAIEMRDAVEAALPADLAIFAAAVADWHVAPAAQKLKKTNGVPPALTLAENPDILASIAAHSAKRPTLVVGFAAETADVIPHAQAKLKRKGCDLIIANDVSATSGIGNGVFGGDVTQVHLVSAAGVESWPMMSKAETSGKLITHLAQLLSTMPETEWV